jgi:hypothetical protein
MGYSFRGQLPSFRGLSFRGLTPISHGPKINPSRDALRVPGLILYTVCPGLLLCGICTERSLP